MTIAMPELFAGALSEAGSIARINDRDAVTKALLARMAEKGALLEEMAGPRFMGLHISKLRKFCDRFDIQYPDYIPPQMRATVKYSVRKGVATFVGEHAVAITSLVGADGPSFPVTALREHKQAIQFAGYEPRRVKAEKLNG